MLYTQRQWKPLTVSVLLSSWGGQDWSSRHHRGRFAGLPSTHSDPTLTQPRCMDECCQLACFSLKSRWIKQQGYFNSGPWFTWWTEADPCLKIDWKFLTFCNVVCPSRAYASIVVAAILKFTDRSTVIHAWLYAMGFHRSAGRVLLLLCGGQVETARFCSKICGDQP